MEYVKWGFLAFGFLAFFAAPAAMTSKKGRSWHRLSGKLFLYGVSLSALLVVIHFFRTHDHFLVILAYFGFYLAFSGYRILFRKRPERGSKAKGLDWLITTAFLLLAGGMLFEGFLDFEEDFSPVWVLFGLIGTLVTALDIHSYLITPKSKNHWLFHHIGRMIGSYIAVVTAFSIKLMDMMPLWARWVWPGLVLLPLIYLWIRQYKKRLQPNPFEKERSAHEILYVKYDMSKRKKRSTSQVTEEA